MAQQKKKKKKKNKKTGNGAVSAVDVPEAAANVTSGNGTVEACLGHDEENEIEAEVDGKSLLISYTDRAGYM